MHKPLRMGVGWGQLTDKVKDTAGVAPFVVVPRDQLDEVVVEGNAGGGIEDAGARVAVQVSGDERVLSVAEDTCEKKRKD